MSNQVEIDAILAEAESALATAGPQDPPPSSDEGTAVCVAEPPSETADDSSVAMPPPSPKRLTQEDLKRILQIEVPVIVRLAHRSMRVKEIMKLATGSIIEFEKAADAELDLMINNEVIGHGQAVKVGENFGLRILRILSLRDKIEALQNAQRA